MNFDLVVKNEYDISPVCVHELVQKCEAVSVPSFYYSQDQRVRVLYISDLHLPQHLMSGQSHRGLIQNVVKQLYDSFWTLKRSFFVEEQFIVFAGDIAEFDQREMIAAFFSRFVKEYKYRLYLSFKNRYKRIFGLTQEDCLKRLYEKLRQKQCLVDVARDYLVKRGIDICDDGEYKLRKAVPTWLVAKAEQTKIHIRDIRQLKMNIESLEKEVQWEGRYSVNHFLNKNYLIQEWSVFFVLGNHEYVGAKSVQEAVDWYVQNLAKYGISILQNCSVQTKHCVIYGGTGFAKYEKVWNANKVCGCVTRDEEIRETDLFEEEYRRALSLAKQTDKLFLCVSHYHRKHCLASTDREAIYFSGHTHRNERVQTEDLVVYADNQIGYTAKNFRFKLAETGYVANPYAFLSDGYHVTNLEEYMMFMRYSCIPCAGFGTVARVCRHGDMYVLKRFGYYGFFIVNSMNGISIVVGGITRKITLSTNIQWIYNNFEQILLKYMTAMLPFWEFEQKFSIELQRLGCSGTIHGSIIDLDFENHVMLNPVTGEATCYYAPMSFYGQERYEFSSLSALLQYHAKHGTNCLQNLQMMSSTSDLVEVENLLQISCQPMFEKYGAHDLYAMSKMILSLQRLFTARVLQQFDVTLVQASDEHQKLRKTNYYGQVCFFVGGEHVGNYFVEDDDQKDTLLLRSLEDGHLSKLSFVRMKSLQSQKKIFWVTSSLSETKQQFGDYSYIANLPPVEQESKNE